MILIYLPLYIIALAGLYKISKKFELCEDIEAPFFIISFQILFLYFFALYGNLNLGLKLLITLGILLFFYYRKVSLYNKNFFWNIILFITPIILIFLLFPINFTFTQGDEFNWWGPSIKWMYETDALWGNSMLIGGANHYPPGQQLFQYGILKIFGWSERTVIFSDILLINAALIAGTCRILDCRRIQAFGFYLFCIAGLYFFRFSLFTAYVDAPIAAIFFCGIIYASTSRGNIKDCLKVSIIIFLLIELKQIGLILAIFVYLIYIISLIFSNKIINLKDFYKLTLYGVLPLISIYLSYTSWINHISSLGLHNTYSVPNLSYYFTQPMLGRLGLTAIEFIKRIQIESFIDFRFFIRPERYSQPSLMITSISLSIFSILFSTFGCKENRFKIFIVAQLLIFFAIIYIAFHMFVYLTIWGEYEGLTLASFERYMSIYFYAWFLYVSLQFFQIINKFNDKYRIALQTLFFVIFLSLCPPIFYSEIFAMKNHLNPQLQEYRVKIDSLIAVLRKHINPDEKAYIVIQNYPGGAPKYIFNYLMLPYKTSPGCWSIGKPYFKGDVWTCDQQISRLMDGYDYLVLYKTDSAFCISNRSKFLNDIDCYEGGVFRIDKQDDLFFKKIN